MPIPDLQMIDGGDSQYTNNVIDVSELDYLKSFYENFSNKVEEITNQYMSCLEMTTTDHTTLSGDFAKCVATMNEKVSSSLGTQLSDSIKKACTAIESFNEDIELTDRFEV